MREGNGYDPTRGPPESMDRLFQMLKRMCRTASSNYEIGCLLAVPPLPPVRRVDILKATGGTRTLSIPTVMHRVAQMVVKQALEPLVEPIFLEASMVTAPTSRPSRQLGKRGSDAGCMTGFLIWISKAFSIPSLMSF
tara:strand:- start:22353 stop:22763 length:411 start_codon:yes stop_codon:yes gene_type:complete